MLERRFSEDSQMTWLHNEGAIMGLVPAYKGKNVRGRRGRRLLFAAESFPRFRRCGSMMCMVPHFRRVTTVTPANIHGIIAARLTRGERDAWDRLRLYIEQDEERAERDPDWMHDFGQDVARRLKNAVSVQVPG